MSNRGTREWPLIGFTVGIQLGCGLVMAITAAHFVAASCMPAIRLLAVAVFPLVACASALSVFHLGRPLAARRALLHLGYSPLSTEVALTAIFAVSTLVYSTLWLIGGTGLVVLGCGTSVLGALAVISSARIYAIPAQRFWNAGWVMLSFVASTLLLGGMTLRIFLGPDQRWAATKMEEVIQVAAIALLVSAVWMMRALRSAVRGRYRGPAVRPLMNPKNWITLCGFVVLASVLPLCSARGTGARGDLILLAACAVAGVALGRTLMYRLGTRLARF